MIVNFRGTSPSTVAKRKQSRQGWSPGSWFLALGLHTALCRDMTSNQYANNDTVKHPELRNPLSIISGKSLTSLVSFSFTDGKTPEFQLADSRESQKLYH